MVAIAPTSLDEVAERLLRYRNGWQGCWSFMTECMFTIDQTDTYNPIKPYPARKEMEEYLRVVVKEIVTEPLLAAVKHRRILGTWTCCGVVTWDFLFFEGRFNAIVCKKEKDSDDLVRRCKFILDHIPPEKMPILPTYDYTFTRIVCKETDSVIKGFPQGEEQLRQFTCSRVFVDEFAKLPQARATFVALKPTLEGGGKVCLISTRWPGFFQDLVEDKIDET